MKPRMLMALLALVLLVPAAMAEEDKAPEQEEQKAPAVYAPMEPLVVNVADQGRVRHMQVTIQLKLSSADMQQYINKYNPALRHELIMLLSDQPAKKLASASGKIALRDEALAALQEVMQENIKLPAIEAVYFTEMIIQ